MADRAPSAPDTEATQALVLRGPRLPTERRHRALALLALLAAAALLGYAGCRGQDGRSGGPAGGLLERDDTDSYDNRGHGDRDTRRLHTELTAPDLLVPGPRRPTPAQPGDLLGLGRAIHVLAGAAPGGTGGPADPLASVQAALERAQPGDTVRVGPGTYPERLRTVRAGTQDRPIWLVGDRARIVQPAGRADTGSDDSDDADTSTDSLGRLVMITHDHLVLDGFDVSGGDINIWVFRASNVRLLRNTIHDARGECVRMKYFSSHNEVAFNRIDRCGLEGFDVDEDKKNGEGIYIGTAPEQRKEKNPTKDPDRSDANHVHDNLVSSPAECVDVKEAARANVVERNTCERGQDPDGGGFSSRGLGTMFLENISRDHLGAGIRLGGDKDSDGVRSVVRGNQMLNNRGYGLKIQTEPQRIICGNTLQGNGDGPVNSAELDPGAPCPG